MSTQLKEKQQTKSKEQVPTRDLQADYHFNQHLFRTVAYTAAGFGFGMLSSLLFKHKAGMTIFFAGAGAGYGSADFVNDLNKFRNQRGPTQIKREGGASSQIREKLDRTADSLKGDLQQAKNKVERGVEDMSGQVAGKVSQTARGAEEWARNASEKATQHFQSKDYRRGGDDDKDKDDSKSGKKETPRKDDSSLKRDVKDQVKQSAESLKKGAGDLKDKVKDSAESLKKDFKKDDSSLKKDAKDVKDQVKQSAESLKKSAGDLKDKAKDSAESLKKNAGDLKGKAKESVESLKKSAGDVKDKVKESAESLKKDFKKDDTQKKDQKKDDSSLKKDAKDLKDKVKDSAESLKKDFKKDDSQKKDQSKDQSKDLGEKTSFNTTLKGGMSTTAKKEEGSKEHRLMGDMRADQFTSKLPDKSPFQEGYSTPKPEQEGPVKVKREDKSQGGQDKTKADINRTYNQGGQHFQDFRSNPNELGKAGEISEIKQDYQRNRNKAADPEADEKRRATKHLAQDIHGESIRQGLRHDVNMHSETRSGFQNYRTGVAPGDKANQENTKL